MSTGYHNPVRAGIAERPEEYKYSSAIDYADGKGLLTVEKINEKLENILMKAGRLVKSDERDG